VVEFKIFLRADSMEGPHVVSLAAFDLDTGEYKGERIIHSGGYAARVANWAEEFAEFTGFELEERT
jgi:hypothetical protein